MDSDFKKILIAVDDSKYSVKAVKTGYGLARATGASVALVHVVDIAITSGDIVSGAYMPEVEKAMKTSSEQLLAEMASKYGTDVDTNTFIPEDRPVHGILQTAEKWEADLLVMGTHGRTGLSHLMMGSVAEHIVRKSKIPVLVVPNKE